MIERTLAPGRGKWDAQEIGEWVQGGLLIAFVAGPPLLTRCIVTAIRSAHMLTLVIARQSHADNFLPARGIEAKYRFTGILPTHTPVEPLFQDSRTSLAAKSSSPT